MTEPRRTRIPPKLVWHSRKQRWIIVYYHPATLKRCFLTTPVADQSEKGKAAATLHMESQRDQIGAHRLGLRALATAEQGAVTINQICDELVLDYIDEKRRSMASLRSGLAHIRRELGHHKVESLTKAIVLDARRRLVQRGLADATVNRAMVHLMRAWAVAKDHELVSRGPSFKIERFKEYSRKGLVTPEELAAVNAAEPWAAARDRNEWAYRTGMRFNEITSLRWDLFDTQRWTMTLDGRDSKNGDDRTFQLSPMLRAIISRRLADRQLGCPYVFQHGGRKLHDHGRWEDAWRRAGLPARETKSGRFAPAKLFHDLRRTAVTNMVEAGIDQQTCMEISGHKTHVVFTRYKITSRKRVAAALEIMDQHIGTLPTQAAIPVRQAPRPTLTRHATARPAGTLGSPDTRSAGLPPVASA